MTTTEYGLLAMVILVPAAVAVMVTLWSLEQALKRNKKQRGRTKTPSADEAATPDGA